MARTNAIVVVAGRRSEDAPPANLTREFQVLGSSKKKVTGRTGRNGNGGVRPSPTDLVRWSVHWTVTEVNCEPWIATLIWFLTPRAACLRLFVFGFAHARADERKAHSSAARRRLDPIRLSRRLGCGVADQGRLRPAPSAQEPSAELMKRGLFASIDTGVGHLHPHRTP